MDPMHVEKHRDFGSLNGAGGGRLGNGIAGTPDSDVDRTEHARSVSANLDAVTKIIRQAQALGAITLDLSNRKLTNIPEEVLQMTNLEYLYLEGNCLSTLPDNFFDSLPNLKWLDLRRNYLVGLPSTYIGRHKNLHNLLLEQNELKNLPLELGMIPTLQGLNIASNPIEFPPSEVLEQGTKEVLRFLREMLITKSQGHLPSDMRFEDLRISTDSNDSGDHHSQTASLPARRSKNKSESTSRRSSVSEELVGPIPSRSPLHTHINYTEKRLQYLDKLKRAGALGPLDKNGRPQKPGNKLRGGDLSSRPASQDMIDVKLKAERKANKRKDKLEKQDVVLQRRRDDQVLKEWRDESKRLQQKRYRDNLRTGKKDFLDPVELAPFGIDDEFKRIPTNEERIKLDIKNEHERVRKVLSPRSQHQLEAEKYMREKELEKKIKLHSMDMKDRRKKPKGNPQQEMEAAKKELEIAEMLQQEMKKRRQDLEYRFKAFTG